MNFRSLIPSMFLRRLLAILVLAVVAMALLCVRLFNLTIVQGAELRAAAEDALTEQEFLPTTRGPILDRHGRILAEDRPSVDVLVDYRLLSGEWVTSQAADAARRADPEKWNELSPDERSALIKQREPEFAAQLDRVWDDLAAAAGMERAALDASRAEIQRRVESMARFIWEKWRKEQENEFQTRVTIADVARPIQEQRQSHPLILAVPAQREADLRRLALTGPAISRTQQAITIRLSGARTYPFRSMQIELSLAHFPAPLRAQDPLLLDISNVAGLMLGSMRDKAYAEDIQRRPMRLPDGAIDLKGYQAADAIGATGLESSLEDTLRGARGVTLRHLDSQTEEHLPAKPGFAASLSLDINLQARIQALLDPRAGLTVVQPWHGRESRLPLGLPLNAAAVVLDVETSEVLALVTNPAGPSPDSSAPNRPWAYSTMDAGLIDGTREVPCPPGSIVKPLLLCGAVTAGAWELNRSIDCRGHLYPNDPSHYRCWIFRPNSPGMHGPLDAVGALARSCNIYFYSIGRSMGAELERYWYEQWGVGRDFDIGLSVMARRMPAADQITQSEEIMLGIGQGRVEWTPLHAAAAYAALARGGKYISPTLIHGRAPDTLDLVLDSRAVSAVLQGLDDVVNNRQYGGARHLDVDGPGGAAPEPIFDVPGVHVWGKTGTAQQVMPQDICAIVNAGEELTGDEETAVPNAQDAATIGAHSWFVGLAGPDSGAAAHPRYVIAVFVEWGGSGSRCAAPIANAIVAALAEEGYLP